MNTEDILHEIAKQSGGEYREWDTGLLYESSDPSHYLRRNFQLQTPTRSFRDVLELPALSQGIPEVLAIETEKKRVNMIFSIAKEGISSSLHRYQKVRLDRMHKIISYCLSNKLPKEHHFFGTTEEIRQLTDWLSMLGSSGMQTIDGSGKEHITFFMFAGFGFYYHDMDKLPTNKAV